MPPSAAKNAKNRGFGGEVAFRGGAMDLRKLKKLIDLVQGSGIAELEITEGEEKVKIVKGGAVTLTGAAPVGLAPAPAAPAAPPQPAAAAPAPATEPEPGQEGHVV